MTHPLANHPNTNPYPNMWTDAIRALGGTVDAYRSLRVILNPPHVIHIHWPEYFLPSGTRSLARRARGILRLAALRIARKRGAIVAWTVHNSGPHDGGDDYGDNPYIRAFQGCVDLQILLSGRTLAPLADTSSVVVPHPAYPTHSRTSAPTTLDHDGRLLSFGEMRRYKGYVELIGAVQELNTHHIHLRLVGAAEGDYATELEAAVRQAATRIEWHNARVDDETLEKEILKCDAVILKYGRVLNSGAALLALSLHRPVILPDTAVFRDLRDEVGHAWVHLFNSEGDSIARAIEACLTTQRQGLTPNLSARTWTSAASSTLNAFEAAIAEPRVTRF